MSLPGTIQQQLSTIGAKRLHIHKENLQTLQTYLPPDLADIVESYRSPNAYERYLHARVTVNHESKCELAATYVNEFLAENDQDFEVLNLLLLTINTVKDGYHHLNGAWTIALTHENFAALRIFFRSLISLKNTLNLDWHSQWCQFIQIQTFYIEQANKLLLQYQEQIPFICQVIGWDYNYLPIYLEHIILKPANSIEFIRSAKHAIQLILTSPLQDKYQKVFRVVTQRLDSTHSNLDAPKIRIQLKGILMQAKEMQALKVEKKSLHQLLAQLIDLFARLLTQIKPSAAEKELTLFEKLSNVCSNTLYSIAFLALQQAFQHLKQNQQNFAQQPLLLLKFLHELDDITYQLADEVLNDFLPTKWALECVILENCWQPFLANAEKLPEKSLVVTEEKTKSLPCTAKMATNIDQSLNPNPTASVVTVTNTSAPTTSVRVGNTKVTDFHGFAVVASQPIPTTTSTSTPLNHRLETKLIELRNA